MRRLRSKRQENRYAVVNGGRRIHKTDDAIKTAIEMAVESPYPGEVWYGAPSYRQAKMVAWQRFHEQLERQPVKLKVGDGNATDLTIPLIKGRWICLKGMDNPDSLRGPGPIGFVGDEWAFVKDASAWDLIIQPAMADKMAPAVFYSTPQGRNHFHRMWENGRPGPHRVPGWFSVTIKSEWVKTIHPDELLRIQKELPQDYYRQEFEGEFLGYLGLVWPEFIDRPWPEGHILPLEMFKDVVGEDPFYFGSMDYGFTDPTVLHLWALSAAGTLVGYDEFSLANVQPEVFMQRYLASGRKPPAVIYGDPSMWNKEGTSGTSAAMQFIRKGWGLRPARHMEFRDSALATRKLMLFPQVGDLALYPKLMFLEEKCPKAVVQFRTLQSSDLKPSGSGFKDRVDCHASDSVRYGAMEAHPRAAIEVQSDTSGPLADLLGASGPSAPNFHEISGLPVDDESFA